MEEKNNHDLWIAHPTGSIPKGAFCQSCARFNNRPTAVSCILLKDSKVLLLQRAQEPAKGLWDLPGGYLDWDETLEETAARELQEETGLVVTTSELQFFTYFSGPSSISEQQVVEMYFLAKDFTGEIKLDPSEISDYKWVPITDLSIDIAFDHRQILEKLATS